VGLRVEVWRMGVGRQRHALWKCREASLSLHCRTQASSFGVACLQRLFFLTLKSKQQEAVRSWAAHVRQWLRAHVSHTSNLLRVTQGQLADLTSKAAHLASQCSELEGHREAALALQMQVRALQESDRQGQEYFTEQIRAHTDAMAAEHAKAVAAAEAVVHVKAELHDVEAELLLLRRERTQQERPSTRRQGRSPLRRKAPTSPAMKVSTALTRSSNVHIAKGATSQLKERQGSTPPQTRDDDLSSTGKHMWPGLS